MFIIGRETLDLQTSRRMSLLDARKCTLHARSKPMHYEVNSGFHFELKKTWRKYINLGFKNAISVRIKMLPCSADAACFSSVKGVVGNVFYKKNINSFHILICLNKNFLLLTQLSMDIQRIPRHRGWSRHCGAQLDLLYGECPADATSRHFPKLHVYVDGARQLHGLDNNTTVLNTATMPLCKHWTTAKGFYVKRNVEQCARHCPVALVYPCWGNNEIAAVRQDTDSRQFIVAHSVHIFLAENLIKYIWHWSKYMP